MSPASWRIIFKHGGVEGTNADWYVIEPSQKLGNLVNFMHWWEFSNCTGRRCPYSIPWQLVLTPLDTGVVQRIVISFLSVAERSSHRSAGTGDQHLRRKGSGNQFILWHSAKRLWYKRLRLTILVGDFPCILKRVQSSFGDRFGCSGYVLSWLHLALFLLRSGDCGFLLGKLEQ